MVNTTTIEEIEVDDLIVLLLGAPSLSKLFANRIDGITRIEKLLFLLKNETSINKEFTKDLDFIPYDFGPFSKKVYQAVEFLQSADLITETHIPSKSSEDTWETTEIIGFELSNTHITRSFSLTERGIKYYSLLVLYLSKSDINSFEEIKKRFQFLPLRQIARYIHIRYPEMTQKIVSLHKKA